MLRTTFHLDSKADDLAQSFMAVHGNQSKAPKIEIVNESHKLNESLRRPFNLSEDYPIRWVIQQNLSVEGGQLNSHLELYAIGHHIAVDGSSMSYLSIQLLNELGVLHAQKGSSPSSQGVIHTYGEYVQRQNAYLRTESAADAKRFWLSQTENTCSHAWQGAIPRPPDSKNYRELETWAFFTNKELQDWSTQYRTSWFRIATSVIGLITSGLSLPSPHHDHCLQVAFGARESMYSDCVSHMANTMPIRVPLTQALTSGADLSSFVKQLGKFVSQAKKFESYPFLSLLDNIRQRDLGADLECKVAVTFSPKLASEDCTLFPVEGIWDLFFCFLEREDGVSLGVRPPPRHLCGRRELANEMQVIRDPRVVGPSLSKQLRQAFSDTIQVSRSSPEISLRDLSFLQNHLPATLCNGPAMDQHSTIESSRVCQWISARAEYQPEAIALHSAEAQQSWTYGELEQRSNQLCNSAYCVHV